MSDQSKAQAPSNGNAGSSVVESLEKTRLSLSDRAYADLEERIVTLELTPGAVLSEARLGELLQIGRTPIREALHRLAREGLVIIMPRRGIVVADLDIRRQLKMLEVRRELERLVAVKAAERALPAQRERFVALADQMRDCVDRDDAIAFVRLDREFNELLIDAAHNEFIGASLALMAGLSRRFWFMHSQRSPGLATIARRHADVAAAVAQSDADRAAAASDELLDFVESITRNAIDW